MLNIMRADLYRIFKGKGVYITTGIFLFLVILQIASGSQGTIGVNTNMNMTDLPSQDLILTGVNAPSFIMQVTDNLLYFLLPFVIFVSAADFSSGTIKNVLSNGASRSKYYISKLILSCLFCIALAVLNLLTSIITATIINGFGGSLNGEFITSVLKPYSLQLFLLLAATCVGTFFVFATKKTAAVNGIYIAFFIVPVLLILILSEFSDKFLDLINYDITMSLKMLSDFSSITANDIKRTLFLGTFYIIISTVGGLFIFRKSEMK